ncbi:MAG: terminase [Mesorhizobium sp.]|uniref:terminase large subunit n=1 Tax=Mesorhizobium sp. TaxID=1871066 RepID=UPI000FE7DC5B|nr:terminase TerL endonuclease subunit [Mesorhizobium sp.]RWD33352.1 MAG: terminase [Mesorhizobium sp.]TJW69311.1 MAG: terminase [Mesorhizobium sp.]
MTRAERNIRWIEDWCRVPEGKDIGQPIRLREWQKDDLRKIYDNPHGTRLAIISFGKKNGKTSLAGCLLLLHLCGPEAIPNTQLPSTAQSKEQAAVLFNLAAKMVRLNPELDRAIIIRDTIKQLFCPGLGTLYKALSADASTAHGQSPIFAVHDELGQVRGPVSELYNAIENAMGAHDAPMSVIISTQAPNDGDLLSILIDDAQAGHDPHTVCSLYSADMSIDPFSEEALKQANPAFDDFLNASEIRKQAENAKRLPSQEPLYRNYTLNQRVEASSPFISRAAWLDCGAAPSDFKGRPVYGGLDLSEVSDLTALVLVAPVGGFWSVAPTFWLPSVGLREKARSDRVPYDVWAKEGHLATTPGPTVDYEYIADVIADVFDRHDVRKIAFDRWNWRHLKPWLSKAGFTDDQLEGDKAVFEPMGQGFQSMSPALRELESAILNRKIAHGNHPVLGMCAANATVQTDPAGNRKFIKRKSHGRIDGMVALAMAMSVASTYQEAPPPKYQMLFVG